MKQVIPFFSLLLFSCVISLTSCSKDESFNRDALNKIFKLYENGQIVECIHNGNIVYSASLNVYDGGGSVFDYDGNPLSNCNFIWGPVESACLDLDNCKVIYRVKDNIWGLPAVNVYFLGLR